jgi:hypothetical protein
MVMLHERYPHMITCQTAALAAAARLNSTGRSLLPVPVCIVSVLRHCANLHAGTGKAIKSGPQPINNPT